IAKPAFDHEKLAAALSTAMGGKYTALTLPFAPPAGGRGGAAGRGAATGTPTTSPLAFVDNERKIRFGSGGALWSCTLADYTCVKEGPIPASAAIGRGGRGAPFDYDQALANPEPVGGDPVDGLEYQAPPPQAGAAGAGSGRGPSG